MELPSIGKTCSYSGCKQLDFLPLQCSCGSNYCYDHFNLHIQSCKTSKFLTEDELRNIQDVFVCSHPDCDERDIVSLICDKCKKHFCIRHRHLVECAEKSAETLAKEKLKYTIPVKQFNEAKAAVDRQLENNLNKAKKTSRNSEMAKKLQLMKLKNKATGLKTIPVAQRVYFNVTFSKKHEEKTAPVFVSSLWTVGRAIDAIAQEMQLQNRNNISNENKLRLFKKDEKIIISEDVSVLLSDLINRQVIADGESLIIAYVDLHCIKL